MKEIKVVIAEDHDLLSESYRMLLEGDGLNVVGVVKNGIELLKWLPKNDVDVIVLDIEMPVMDGIEVIEYLLKQSIEYKILVVSAHHSDSFVKACKEKFNVKGYITKAYCDLELTEGVLEVYKGGFYYSQMQALENMETSYIKQKMLEMQLSEGEKDLLQLLPEYTYNEISERKGISYWSVKNTFLRIRDKLGLNSNIELAKLLVDKENRLK